MKSVSRLKERKSRGMVAEGDGRRGGRVGDGVGIGVEAAEVDGFMGASTDVGDGYGAGSKKKLFASRSIGSTGEGGEASGEEGGLRLLTRRRRCRRLVVIRDLDPILVVVMRARRCNCRLWPKSARTYWKHWKNVVRAGNVGG